MNSIDYLDSSDQEIKPIEEDKVMHMEEDDVYHSEEIESQNNSYFKSFHL